MIKICKKYSIDELSIFGSSIRGDFNEDSDVDILVSFTSNSKITLFDIIELESEFKNLLGREVDVVEKESLKNPIRKNKILSSRKIIYAIYSSCCQACSGLSPYSNRPCLAHTLDCFTSFAMTR